MQSNTRSFAPLHATLALWSLAMAAVFFEVLNWPYLGAEFRADVDGRATEVTSIRHGSPADAAGLAAGDRVVAIAYGQGLRYEMTGFEAIQGREELHSYDMSNQAKRAKSRMWALLNSGPLTLETEAGKRVTLQPDSGRALSTLSFPFFGLMVESLIISLIAAALLAFAPRTLAVGLAALSAYAASINILLNMLKTGSELSMPDSIYAIGSSVGPVAILTSAGALLSLLWYYPAPIGRLRFGWLVLAFVVLVNVGQQFQLFVFPIHPYQGPGMVLMLGAVVVSVLSWRRTAGKPLERATVMWLILSTCGVTLFSVMIFTLPALLKMPTLVSANVALFNSTLVYVGIALGTLKFRLFDMQRVWWRTITWLVGGMVVVLTDFLLISQFDFEQRAALPVALLFAGWVYFPLRQYIFQYFVASRSTHVSSYVPQLIDRFSAIEANEEFDGRFVAFLRDVFDARELGRVGRAPVEKSTLEDNGLSLRTPDISGKGSILLVGKSNGRELFSSHDLSVADSFVRIVRYIGEASQREFEKLQTHRQQIVRDLHDDVGGRLLSMILNAPDERFSNDARQTLGALKESLIVIENTKTVDASVAWQRMKEEAAQRFREAGFELLATEDICAERALLAREFLNLKRIVQEIVSNAIKYGEKGAVSANFTVSADRTVIFTARNRIRELTDDTLSTNRGLANIRTRLSEVAGDMTIDVENMADADYYRIDVVLPFTD